MTAAVECGQLPVAAYLIRAMGVLGGVLSEGGVTMEDDRVACVKRRAERVLRQSRKQAAATPLFALIALIRCKRGCRVIDPVAASAPAQPCD